MKSIKCLIIEIEKGCHMKMELIRHTIRARETYEVKIESSLLWECALGIAAVTNTRLISHMEKPMEEWDNIKNKLSNELLNELEIVQKHNTWKALLQLLHQKEFDSLHMFVDYINHLSDRTLRFICLPYIGSDFQQLRCDASTTDETAIKDMQEVTENNSFFPKYVEYISSADADFLKRHLVTVMTGWYEAIIKPEEKQLQNILEKDKKLKESMYKKMTAEELVEWATGGIIYHPEPSVKNVMLIPQYTYRPWNIEADIEETKVFYYSVSDESIRDTKPYAVNPSLVLRYKALGDETRMRMVKLLSEGECSLQEITERLALGKTTAHHHLKILKTAKLVDTETSKYKLKQQALQWMNEEMGIYLSQ